MKEPSLKLLTKSLPGVFRFSVAGFLAAMVILIMAAPFIATLPSGQMIESGLMTLVLASAVLAVGHERRVLIFGVFLVLPAVLGRWVHHFWPSKASTLFFLFSAMVFIAFVIWQLLRFILRTPRVGVEVLCAGIANYLLLGMLWGFAYMTVANVVVNKPFLIDGQVETVTDMTTFTAIYFSYATLTTVGYGDIVPNCGVARMLAAMEAVTGTLYVAILISRLVSLYSKTPEADTPHAQNQKSKGGS